MISFIQSIFPFLTHSERLFIIAFVGKALPVFADGEFKRRNHNLIDIVKSCDFTSITIFLTDLFGTGIA
jgi:hypothetical protein